MKRIFGIVAILSAALALAPAPAWADEHIVGHITPLPGELLDNPVGLHCGATIVEWRGTAIAPGAAQRVDILCTLARDHFEPFIARYGIKPEHRRPFRFSVALLPDTGRYRDLNDLRFRFAYRPEQREVWGYTSITNKYLFLLSSTGHPEFAPTFVHELFHAMSDYYGVFDQHPGSYEEEGRREEQLAVAFERELVQRRPARIGYLLGAEPRPRMHAFPTGHQQRDLLGRKRPPAEKDEPPSSLNKADEPKSGPRDLLDRKRQPVPEPKHPSSIKHGNQDTPPMSPQTAKETL